MTTAIEPRKAADVSVWDYVQIEPSGLVFRDSITYEVWCDLGAQLQDLERRIMWMIGDWLAYGEAKYGDKYTQALEATDYAQQTLRNAVWVANAIDLSRRRDGLSWKHHALVARLDPDEQDAMLEAAEDGGWSTRELAQAVRTGAPEPDRFEQALTHLKAAHGLLIEADAPSRLTNALMELIVAVEAEASPAS